MLSNMSGSFKNRDRVMTMSEKKIYLVPGFHMNFNHSWRGDRNDRSGFGLDSIVVEGILNILDAANEKGLPARGTWDFDNYWTIEHIMKTYAPELLDRIIKRVKDGRDEVILDAWNNGMYGAMSEREFRETLKRTISNSGGSGVMDVFGKYTPAIRTQETTFTQGNIELLLEQGVEAIALYYSSVPFDSIKNFVNPLSPEEMFNLLWFKSTVSDARMKMIPMYSQGDIINNGFAMKTWLKKIRKMQNDGTIKGNALLYLNMDADAELWTGLNLPGALSHIPGARGLEEFIEVANKLDYVEMGSLGEYMSANDPVGEITVRQDLADGSFTGYNSWTEKEENHRLWRISQRGRRYARIAESAAEVAGKDAARDASLKNDLDIDKNSYFENKLLLLSTTHFGMHAPAVHEERAQVGFNHAVNLFEKARESAVGVVGAIPVGKGEENIYMKIGVLNHNRDSNATNYRIGAKCLLQVPFESANCPVPPSGVGLHDEEGNRVIFDIENVRTDDKGNLCGGTICFVHTAGSKRLQTYFLGASRLSGSATKIKAGCVELSNGLLIVRLDKRGRVRSLEMDGKEFSTGQLFSVGATYKAEKNRKLFTPRSYELVDSGVGPADSMGWITLESRVVIFREGKNYTISNKMRLMLMEGLPYLFVDSVTQFPDTPCDDDETSVATGSSRKFDTAWYETMPLQVSPGIPCNMGAHMRLWKRNYLGVVDYYDFNYGEIDDANRDLDACNNHVTDGWVGLSGADRGVVISCDATVNSSPAYCPARVRESEGRQKVLLNPFGTFSGKQLSHLHDGFNMGASIMKLFAPQLRSVAPSYNGKTIPIRMMVAPFAGGTPPEEIQADADSFSMPPAVLTIGDNGKYEIYEESNVQVELEKTVNEFNLNEVKDWNYGDFLNFRNKDLTTGVPSSDGGISPMKILKLIVDGIRDWS